MHDCLVLKEIKRKTELRKTELSNFYFSRKIFRVVAGAPWLPPALYSHGPGSVGIAGEVTVLTVLREGKRAAPPQGEGPHESRYGK
jgi:hypothetical protein